MTDEENSVKPSTASVDRRVGRLEERQDEMQRSIDRLELGMQHQSELNRARFDAMDASISQVNSTLGAFIAEIRVAQLEAAKMLGDATATPAGRLIVAEITDLQKSRDTNTKAIEMLNVRAAAYAGGLAVLVAFLTLFGPNIRSALF